MTGTGRVAVRLEGGLGDHILGMRLLKFIRRRYPDQSLVVYSDSGGYQAQLEVVRLSPAVSDVIPAFKDPLRVTIENLGHLNNLEGRILEEMRSADAFFDASVGGLFIQQSRELGVSLYEILASRPELVVPADAAQRARQLLAETDGDRFLTVNLAKFGAEALRGYLPSVRPLLMSILENPAVRILNVFTRNHDFPHWPEPMRTRRREAAAQEAEVLAQMSDWSPGRIVPIIDEPVAVVAALLVRSQYFIGVDNGVKHLAWALNVPRTYVNPWPPDRTFILQWAPDYHRMLLLNGPQHELMAHVAEAKAALNGSVRDIPASSNV